MELIKRNIHMSRVKNNFVTQVTLDDDFNVPDTKPDIEKVICDKTRAVLENSHFNDKKAIVTGQLEFMLLYQAENSMIDRMAGVIPINETVNIEDASDGTYKTAVKIDDVTIKIINSRKISVRAILSIVVTAEEFYDEEIITGVDEEDMCVLEEKLEYAQLAISSKDTLRVREDIELPQSKPNIEDILWHETEVSGISTRVTEEGLTVKGEAKIFVIYKTADEKNPYIWHEDSKPFTGVVDISGSSEDMISEIEVNLSSEKVEVKTDYDGEDRIIAMDIVLELDIKTYEENSMDMISDMYSTKCEVKCGYDNVKYERLLIKNTVKNRVTGRIKVNEKVLTICHVTGQIKIDNVELEGDYITVEGVVIANIMYIGAENDIPVASMSGTIPFEEKIEVKGINENARYNVGASIENIMASMISGEEAEIKVSILLDVIAFARIEKNVIQNVMLEETDKNAAMKKPALVGYVVKQGDTLWDIAKRYKTTIDTIKTVNELSGERIAQGEKIIIV